MKLKQKSRNTQNLIAATSSTTSIKTTNNNDSENIENAHFLFQNMPIPILIHIL